MDIKTRIIEILNKENYTFTELCEFLQMPEEKLTSALNDKTLEFRNLEAISKALRVPLYSFFRSENFKFDFSQKPYYINKLWTGDDDEKNILQLKNEITLLKKIIALKEESLKKLG